MSVSVEKKGVPPSAVLPASSVTPTSRLPCAAPASMSASAAQQNRPEILVSGIAAPGVDPTLDFHVLRRTCSGSLTLVIGGDGGYLILERGEDRIEQGCGAEPNRVVGRQPGLLGGRGDRGPGVVLVEPVRVEREAGD